jgi:uncharacterized DUF497 family protein
MHFTWDEAKRLVNLNKHGIDFHEASTVIVDPLVRTMPDPLHSNEEDRYVALGTSDQQRLLVVIFTYRNDQVRIISGRKATAAEKRMYANAKEI